MNATGSVCVAILAGLCLAGPVLAGGTTNAPKKVKLPAPPRAKGEYKYVEVTGSRIRYRVRAGESASAVPVNVSVIDLRAVPNQGYGGVLDVVRKNPNITPGFGRR